jgi:hypothetical protein
MGSTVISWKRIIFYIDIQSGNRNNIVGQFILHNGKVQFLFFCFFHYYLVNTLFQYTFFEMWEKFWILGNNNNKRRADRIEVKRGLYATHSENLMGTKHWHDLWRGRHLCKRGGFEPKEQGSRDGTLRWGLLGYFSLSIVQCCRNSKFWKLDVPVLAWKVYQLGPTKSSGWQYLSGPNQYVPPPIHMRAETGPLSETFCFWNTDDSQNPSNPSNFKRLRTFGSRKGEEADRCARWLRQTRPLQLWTLSTATRGPQTTKHRILLFCIEQFSALEGQVLILLLFLKFLTA